LRGLFVTGTGTGVGKSVVTGATVAALSARGIPVAARKPLLTGLDDPVDPDWPPDHELLARAAGCDPASVVLRGYGPAVAPHLAAALAGERIDRTELVATLSAAGDERVLIVEGVGGLLVPLSDDGGFSVRDLAADLSLPVVVVATPGLGTINHTLLTLEAARAGGLTIAGVVLTPWPSRPGEIELSNRETIAQLGDVDVSVVGPIARADRELLAAAGAGLPIEEWLGALPSAP
jgi:dethiobiotin synthetase